ncbi:MAG: MATE family efflux transporter [Solirubrobacteraceae bacterium]|nr:MATE family efflux transporter [Solirubrobacteraceae bacterium]
MAPTLNRRIAAIAIPALGSLIAEPLYLLVDAAIVGHLGTRELAALAIATQALLTIVSLCVFLAYGTTTEVARGGDERTRAALGAQGLWLGAATGVAVAAGLLLFAGPIARAIGGDSAAVDLAARYLRISAVGVAAQLVAIAGQGWLRGREQLTLALKLVVVGQVINIVAEVVLVYGLDLGLDGSALGTVVAQVCVALASVTLVVRAARASGASLRPSPATLARLSRFSSLLLVRSAALSGSYLLVGAYAARISEPAAGAHLVGIQLLWLGALALDALAIAAQVLVAAALGAGDPLASRAAALRITMWSMVFGALVCGLLAVAGPTLVASVFSPDPAVAEAARELWPWLCALQLVGGLVFALDGILIGAQDGRVLALSMVAAAAVLALTLAFVGTSTLTALWTALLAMFLMRTATLSVRALRGPLQAA